LLVIFRSRGASFGSTTDPFKFMDV
jgi:hypothetical protein